MPMSPIKPRDGSQAEAERYAIDLWNHRVKLGLPEPDAQPSDPGPVPKKPIGIERVVVETYLEPVAEQTAAEPEKPKPKRGRPKKGAK